ncbi:Malonyl-(acyl-carrier protein) O-methyltransferase [Gammaproteobacteria bacterium]
MNNTQPLHPFLPDKSRVRVSFDHAATHYDEVAILQREVGTRLLERLDEVRLEPMRILDVGAGTGVGTVVLGQRYPRALVVAIDIAPTMLRQTRRRVLGWMVATVTGWNSESWFARGLTWALGPRGGRGFVHADAEVLPFASECVDLIYSNLTLQWCLDLDRTFAELRRVLRPEGLLVFTTFGPDTLCELRESWRTVDNYSHVNAFIDMHDIGDALNRAGFGGIVMDVEHVTLTYLTLSELMRDLKSIGAHNVTHGRPRGLIGRERFKRLTTAYEVFRRDGRLPATHEVIYGHAWSTSAQSPRRLGEVAIPLSSLRSEPRKASDSDASSHCLAQRPSKSTD